MNNMETQALDKKISFKTLTIFSLPTIASMVCMNIYSTVDGLFVSRLIGTEALAAVSLIMPIIMISMAFGSMIGTGGNALIAKKLEKIKKKKQERIFHCF